MRKSTRPFLHALLAMVLWTGVVLITAGQGYAQDFSGPYFGATAGMAQYSAEFSDYGTTIDDLSASGVNLGVIAGLSNVSGNVYVGIEGNFGQNSADYSESNGERIEVDIEETYGLNISAGYIVHNWLTYGIVGWQRTKMDATGVYADTIFFEGETFDGVRAGIGIEYLTYRQLFFRGEYSYIWYTTEGAVDPSAGIFQFGAGIRF